MCEPAGIRRNPDVRSFFCMSVRGMIPPDYCRDSGGILNLSLHSSPERYALLFRNGVLSSKFTLSLLTAVNTKCTIMTKRTKVVIMGWGLSLGIYRTEK